MSNRHSCSLVNLPGVVSPPATLNAAVAEGIRRIDEVAVGRVTFVTTFNNSKVPQSAV